MIDEIIAKVKEEERKKIFNEVIFSPIFNTKQFGIDFSKCLYELVTKN